MASAPPATAACASPDLIMRIASPIACVPEAHADTTPNTGPCSPWRMATSPAAALPMISGMASGETRSAPRSRRISHCASKVAMPPMPEPITHPTSPGSAGGSLSSHPASATACAAAAIASWAKRSERRASLVLMNSVGSKSVQAPRPSAMPDRPASQPSCSSRAELPRGVIAPTPVITTRVGGHAAPHCTTVAPQVKPAPKAPRSTR